MTRLEMLVQGTQTQVKHNIYTHLHKWLPEVNKQKFTHPPKLQVGVAIGGVAVEAEFVH